MSVKGGTSRAPAPHALPGRGLPFGGFTQRTRSAAGATQPPRRQSPAGLMLMPRAPRPWQHHRPGRCGAEVKLSGYPSRVAGVRDPVGGSVCRGVEPCVDRE